MGEGTGNSQWERMRELFFQRNQSDDKNEKLDRELVGLVLNRARQVVAHPSRPMVIKTDLFSRHPFSEIALEESIEEAPLLDDSDSLLVYEQSERPFSCVTLLDCSSSMSGDKHLLASIAVAVLLLKVPSEKAGLIVFASDAETVKPIGRAEAVEATVLRFLKTAPRGFTNLADGLKQGLTASRGVRGRTVGLIATDGRATEGGDPLEYAKQYDYLIVLHLHGPGSHLEASQALAHVGSGACIEVEDFSELPRRMYDAVRLLGRR